MVEEEVELGQAVGEPVDEGEEVVAVEAQREGVFAVYFVVYLHKVWGFDGPLV